MKSSIRFMGFCNVNHDYNAEALENAKQEVHGLVPVPLNSDAPLLSLDAMRKAISTYLVASVPMSVVVDITCFTRESLAMLMITLKHLLPTGSRLHCLYNTATSYGDKPNDAEHHGWLTRGIVGCRSILGYRGRVRLLAETHLILLPGLEVERARDIIDEVEPNRITIGHVKPGESIRPELEPMVEAAIERLQSFYPVRNFTHFDFSSRDPIITRRGVLGCVVESEDIVVACLNTKPAMMGSIMAALSNSNIQLVYAQPAQYNLKSLSCPSDEAIAFEVPSLVF